MVSVIKSFPAGLIGKVTKQLTTIQGLTWHFDWKELGVVQHLGGWGRKISSSRPCLKTLINKQMKNFTKGANEKWIEAENVCCNPGCEMETLGRL
jgi:hypothetical protein